MERELQKGERGESLTNGKKKSEEKTEEQKTSKTFKANIFI